MSKLYTDSGWINWEYIEKETSAFCMTVGARGVGKTYGLIKFLLDMEKKFLYVRRLQSQLDICSTMDANPFKALNTDTGRNILPFRSGKIVRFCDSVTDDTGKASPIRDAAALGVALSTFHSMRGMDFSDVDYIVFDEAVPSVGEKPIKDQFSVFLNLYQSVNRNRELIGRPPVKCFLLGNANKLGNPYYTGWNFMGTALRMLAGKQMMWRSVDGSRIMLLLQGSRISEEKKKTSLYRNASTDFVSMAAENAFRTDPTNIKSYKFSECRYICSLGEIGIYIHKENCRYYISAKTRPENFTPGYGIHLDMFVKKHQNITVSYYYNKIDFESYTVEMIFREYFSL